MLGNGPNLIPELCKALIRVVVVRELGHRSRRIEGDCGVGRSSASRFRSLLMVKILEMSVLDRIIRAYCGSTSSQN